MRPIIRPQLLLAVLLTGLAGAAADAAGEGSAASSRRDGKLPAPANPEAPANPQASREDAAAAAQAAARRENTLRTIAMRGWIVPREADATNPRARLLLLLPEGPLLTRAVITIDGRPYRAYREKMVAEALQLGDRDGDGRVTWSELAELPAAARYRRALSTNAHAFQLDEDDIVSPREMRYFFAVLNGGAGLSIGPIRRTATPGDAPLLNMLDQDADGLLSSEEMQGAVERIRRQDADDNEILDRNELIERPLSRYGQTATTASGAPFLRYLDADTDWEQLLADLKFRYGRAGPLEPGSFAHTPRLYGRLDTNGDQQLTAAELSRLLQLAPHLELAVRLGSTEEETAPLEVLAVGEDVNLTDHLTVRSDGQLLLEFSQTLVRVSIYEMPDYSASYATPSKRLMQRYDKDKNGYIEAEEVESSRALKEQFDNWDQDGNGMVYEEEILAYYRRQQEPRRHQASVAAMERDDPLLAALDRDRDGSLALREVRDAPRTLRNLDLDGDGTLRRDELPRTINLAFSRTSNAYAGATPRVRRRSFNRPGVDEPASSSPAWFHAMDRNRDGDISHREFLGTERQFRQLDQNGDRLIDQSEAESQSSGLGGRESER